MNRRGFFKLLGGAAVALGLAKVLPAAEPSPVGELTCQLLPSPAMWWIEDPNCPPDRVYLINPKQYMMDANGRVTYVKQG